MSNSRENITSQIQTLAGLYGILEDKSYKDLVLSISAANDTYTNKILIIDGSSLGDLLSDILSENNIPNFNIDRSSLNNSRLTLIQDGDVLIYVSIPDEHALVLIDKVNTNKKVDQFLFHTSPKSVNEGNEFNLKELSVNLGNLDSIRKKNFALVSVFECLVQDVSNGIIPVVREEVKPQKVTRLDPTPKKVTPEPAQVPKPTLLQNLQEVVIPPSSVDEPSFVVPSDAELQAMIAAASSQIGKQPAKNVPIESQFMDSNPDSIADRNFS